MAETEVERLDRQMAELKEKRRAALKREREKERRKEKRRRQLMGDICMEHGDAALMAQIHALIKEHVPVADMPLWPELFPEQALEVVATDTQTKAPSNRGEQALADLKQTARQHAEFRLDDSRQFD